MLSVVDEDANEVHLLQLQDSAAGRFTIDSNILRISDSCAPVCLDFEQTPTIRLSVRALDSGGNSFSQRLTITVVDQNDPPHRLILLSRALPEDSVSLPLLALLRSPSRMHRFLECPSMSRLLTFTALLLLLLLFASPFSLRMQPSPTEVGILTVADDDELQGHVFTLVGKDNDGGLFDISGDRLVFVGKPSDLDYEKRQSLTVSVKVTDIGGLADANPLSTTSTFNIDVTNANDTPAAISLQGNSVAENSAIGTRVGTLTALDQDVDDTISFTLSVYTPVIPHDGPWVPLYAGISYRWPRHVSHPAWPAAITHRYTMPH